MSIIYKLFSFLFLTSTISASVNLAAPPHVYSAIFYNKQNSQVTCTVDWNGPTEDKPLEQSRFTVGSQGNFFTDEKPISMGSWQARGAIKTITCGQVTLSAPFDGVTSPVTNWKFFIYPTEITSGQSHSHDHNNY